MLGKPIIAQNDAGISLVRVNVSCPYMSTWYNVRIQNALRDCVQNGIISAILAGAWIIGYCTRRNNFVTLYYKLVLCLYCIMKDTAKIVRFLLLVKH